MACVCVTMYGCIYMYAHVFVYLHFQGMMYVCKIYTCIIVGICAYIPATMYE